MDNQTQKPTAHTRSRLIGHGTRRETAQIRQNLSAGSEGGRGGGAGSSAERGSGDGSGAGGRGRGCRGGARRRFRRRRFLTAFLFVHLPNDSRRRERHRHGVATKIRNGATNDESEDYQCHNMKTESKNTIFFAETKTSSSPPSNFHQPRTHEPELHKGIMRLTCPKWRRWTAVVGYHFLLDFGGSAGKWPWQAETGACQRGAAAAAAVAAVVVGPRTDDL